MNTYRVTPYDNPLRFLVASASRNGEVEHLVDTGALNGNGQCSCEHFDYRIRPQLEAAAARGHAVQKGDTTRCNHIRAAREALADDFIARLQRLEERSQSDLKIQPETDTTDGEK